MANTMIETLTLWDSAITSWESGDNAKTVDSLTRINQPSSKILFNIGSVHLYLKNYAEAVKVSDVLPGNGAPAGLVPTFTS